MKSIIKKKVVNLKEHHPTLNNKQLVVDILTFGFKK